MLKYHRIWIAAGWIIVALILYLSLTPQPPEPLTFDNADKLEHAFAYAVLSFWFCLLYRLPLQRLVVIAASIGLGVAVEYLQGWTGYRNFEVMDMLADGVGVLSGWLLVCTPAGRLLDFVERSATR